MSRFIDKLNQTLQAEPQTMGFKAAQTATPKPRMLLVASLARAEVSGLADYVAGADAGLLSISNLSSGIKTLKEMRQIVPDIPWGGWLRDISRGGIKQKAKVDCDFVVFPAANTSLAILQNDAVGRILEAEASLSEGLLKAVGELPVDALLIAGDPVKDGFLTWHHLMVFQRFASLLSKPLVVPVPSTVTADELQVLWGAGVDGVIVEVGDGQPVERLRELRQAIDKLAFPWRHRRGRREALLPYSGGEESITAEDEE
jgi:hypothetical protein